MTNCKNCGAPLPANGKCEYCGTNFYGSLTTVKLDVKPIDKEKLIEGLMKEVQRRRLMLEAMPYN